MQQQTKALDIEADPGCTDIVVLDIVYGPKLLGTPLFICKMGIKMRVPVRTPIVNHVSGPTA